MFVIQQFHKSSKNLAGFTKSSDKKQWNLNTSETSLDQIISISQGTW